MIPPNSPSQDFVTLSSVELLSPRSAEYSNNTPTADNTTAPEPTSKGCWDRFGEWCQDQFGCFGERNHREFVMRYAASFLPKNAENRIILLTLLAIVPSLISTILDLKNSIGRPTTTEEDIYYLPPSHTGMYEMKPVAHFVAIGYSVMLSLGYYCYGRCYNESLETLNTNYQGPDEDYYYTSMKRFKLRRFLHITLQTMVFKDWFVALFTISALFICPNYQFTSTLFATLLAIYSCVKGAANCILTGGQHPELTGKYVCRFGLPGECCRKVMMVLNRIIGTAIIVFTIIIALVPLIANHPKCYPMTCSSPQSSMKVHLWMEEAISDYDFAKGEVMIPRHVPADLPSGACGYIDLSTCRNMYTYWKNAQNDTTQTLAKEHDKCVAYHTMRQKDEQLLGPDGYYRVHQLPFEPKRPAGVTSPQCASVQTICNLAEN